MGSTIVRKGVKLDNLIQVVIMLKLRKIQLLLLKLQLQAQLKSEKCMIGGQTAISGQHS